MSWLLEHLAWEGSELQLHVRLRPGTSVTGNLDGTVDIAHCWGTLRLPTCSSATAGMLQTLAADWCDKEHVLATVCDIESADIGHMAALVSEVAWVVDQLGFLLQLRLVIHDAQVMTLESVSYQSRLRMAPFAGGTPQLSRFVFMQPRTGGLVMESAVSGHRVILHDGWAVAVAGALAGAVDRRDPLSPAEPRTQAAIDILFAAGMLSEHEDAQENGFSEQLLATGEFHDLLFHRRSRFGRHDADFGATFPFLSSEPPLPARSRFRSERTIPLPVPDERVVWRKDLRLTQALERRVSTRDFGDDGLTLDQLGEFLFRSARSRAVYGPDPARGMPYQALDRPYPSGGGVHDLELYVLANQVHDLPGGVYHYAADRHVLAALPLNTSAVQLVLDAARRASATQGAPPVLIQVASRFARMSWKYRSISYAATLKNVGVLYQTMYLVATAMDLAACALGSGNDVASSQAFDLASRSEIPVGEFMLGTPRSDTPVDDEQGAKRFFPGWTPLVAPAWGCMPNGFED